MVIDLFTGFSKKINSTKRPTGGRAVTVRLKEPTSVLSPVFLINNYNLAENYVQWGNRYYFVDDIVIVGNELAEYHCSVDVLATYKDAIGASSQYVVRSASAYDLNVVDNFYPTKAYNTHEMGDIQSPFTKDISLGCYIIGLQGKGSGGNGGAVTYYKCTSAGLKSLVNYMLADASIYNVSDITDDLLKCIFNPLQYIVSCMWFPFDVPVMTGSVDFGWWSAEVSEINRVASLEWGTNMSFTIPKHPKQGRGAYMNLLPYSKYTLQAGPWGSIPLDNFNLLNDTTLECDYKVDLITGSGRFNIQFRDKLCYQQIITSQIGVPIQLGQNMLNQGALTDTFSGIGDVLKSAITGDPAGMLTSGLGAIGSAASMTQSIPSSMGGNGTLSFNNTFAILADFIDVVDEDLAQFGRPLCQMKTISSLSGYVLCRDADLDTSGSPSEKSAMLEFMNGGFYYE